MEMVTRRRFYWLGGAMLIAYAISILLIGLAVGFGHGTAQWLFAAACGIRPRLGTDLSITHKDSDRSRPGACSA
jgi:hypothetical protein